MIVKNISIPFKGIKKKTICHFSDLHLTAFDDLSSNEEKERAINQTDYWMGMKRNFAVGNNEPFGEDEMRDTVKQTDDLFCLAAKADAVVATGDLIDYINGANIRLLEKKFSKLKVPFVFVRGNHEADLELPEESVLSIINEPVQRVDLGDMQIIGIDNTNRTITRSQLNTIEKLLGKKPSVIAMHVPILTKQNHDTLIKCGEYFRMNEYEGCPPENQDFIDLISAPKSNVIAVLTGHRHFGNISEINNGVFQYGVSQGLTGNAQLFTIG